MHSMLYIPNLYNTLRCILSCHCIVHLMQYTMILSYTKYMIHVEILNTSPNECTCPIKHSHRTGVHRCVYIIVQHWCISTFHCKLVSMYINYYLILYVYYDVAITFHVDFLNSKYVYVVIVKYLYCV